MQDEIRPELVQDARAAIRAAYRELHRVELALFQTAQAAEGRLDAQPWVAIVLKQYADRINEQRAELSAAADKLRDCFVQKTEV
jgi:hypothetical protein